MVGLLALLATKPGQGRNTAAICGFNKCQGLGSPPNHLSILIHIPLLFSRYLNDYFQATFKEREKKHRSRNILEVFESWTRNKLKKYDAVYIEVHKEYFFNL